MLGRWSKWTIYLAAAQGWKAAWWLNPKGPQLSASIYLFDTRDLLKTHILHNPKTNLELWSWVLHGVMVHKAIRSPGQDHRILTLMAPRGSTSCQVRLDSACFVRRPLQEVSRS